MSAGALHYQPWPDRDVGLRAQIVALAQRHQYYMAETIDLKLHQAGERVTRKRVERRYAQERLHMRLRRRNKIPLIELQPLIRPGAANERWWMAFCSTGLLRGGC
jgi:hypothetical protein